MSAAPYPSSATFETADSLQEPANWNFTFELIVVLTKAGLARAEDWQSMYNDPVVAERIVILRDIQAAIIGLILLNDRSADGRDTVWKLREQSMAIAREENMWYAVRLLSYTSS